MGKRISDLGCEEMASGERREAKRRIREWKRARPKRGKPVALERKSPHAKPACGAPSRSLAVWRNEGNPRERPHAWKA